MIHVLKYTVVTTLVPSNSAVLYYIMHIAKVWRCQSIIVFGSRGYFTSAITVYTAIFSTTMQSQLALCKEKNETASHWHKTIQLLI